MVDVQSISITLAALSFIVAATYSTMNLLEIRRNRRITLTTTIMHPFMTVEGSRDIANLYSMEWSDLDDYNNKYDHRVNPDNFAKRIAVWRLFARATSPIVMPRNSIPKICKFSPNL